MGREGKARRSFRLEQDVIKMFSKQPLQYA